MLICTACYSTNIACPTCGGSGTLPVTVTRPVTRDIRLFAGPQTPLHASAIPSLVQCDWRAALLYLLDPADSSGEAADTGSMTHVGVASWHRDKDIAAAIGHMRESEGKFPLANLAEASAMFYSYTRDPRNIAAEIATHNGEPLLEHKLAGTIAPAPHDPTGAPIYIVGTLDQVRIDLGRWQVWDLKTSKKPGFDQLNMYLYQIAIYAILASAMTNRQIGMGGLITPRHYKQDPATSPPGVFWGYPHKFDDMGPLVNAIRNRVAAIRSGQVTVSPGDYCRYCPMGGTTECLPLLREVSDNAYRVRLPLLEK